MVKPYTTLGDTAALPNSNNYDANHWGTVRRRPYSAFTIRRSLRPTRALESTCHNARGEPSEVKQAP